MSWTRIDDGFALNRKVIAAGNAAVGAWVRMLSHCSAQLTDGAIDARSARFYATRSEIDRLVSVGLLERTDDGFQIPDFLEFNPRAESIRSRRKATAERVAKWRSERVTASVSNASGNSVSNSSPVPSRPVPSQREEIGEPVAVAPAPKAKSSKRKTAWPEGFAVSPAIEAMCRAERLANPHHVFKHFRDWTLAESKTFADWEAAFRNWMRSPLTAQRYPVWAPEPIPVEPEPEYGPPSPPTQEQLDAIANFIAGQRPRNPLNPLDDPKDHQ